MTEFKLTPARKTALAWVVGHRTVFEREVMSPSVTKALLGAGLITKFSGRSGRLSTVTITNKGIALNAETPCPCWACSRPMR